MAATARQPASETDFQAAAHHSAAVHHHLEAAHQHDTGEHDEAKTHARPHSTTASTLISTQPLCISTRRSESASLTARGDRAPRPLGRCSPLLQPRSKHERGRL